MKVEPRRNAGARCCKRAANERRVAAAPSRAGRPLLLIPESASAAKWGPEEIKKHRGPRQPEGGKLFQKRNPFHFIDSCSSQWVGSVVHRRATWEVPEQVVGSARRKGEPTPSQIRAKYVRDAHSSALLGHTGCPAREIRPPRVATLKNESGTAARPLAPAASLPGAARWLAALKLRAAPAMAGARTAEQQRASGRDELPGPGMRAARLPSQGTRARRPALATRR